MLPARKCRWSSIWAAAPGAFPNYWRRHFGVKVIGIDPSLKMLGQARRKPTKEDFVYCQGLAEAVPFRDGCGDLAFMSMSITI